MLTNLQIEVDTHTHTVVSGHAWSTLRENCAAAAALGLKGLCLTEHGPAMDGAVAWFAPCSHKLLPEELYGVRIIAGLEFNIVGFDGALDITHPEALAGIHFGIASMHDVTMPRGTSGQHTEAYVAALQNPAVDILGHPGYACFPNEPEAIVREAKRLGKLIEINNNSFRARSGSRDNCVRFARLCKELEVSVCVASDAHFDTMVGRVPLALQLLEEIDFPPELILNLKYDRFMNYLAGRSR